MAFDAGSIEATLDLRRNPFTQGLRWARQQGRQFEREVFRATLDVDAVTRKAVTGIEALRKTQSARNLKIGVDLDGARIHRQLDEIADSTEMTASRAGNRMARALLNPMVIQFGLLPGIAAASATASALALGVIGGAFAGIAFLAQKNNIEVKNSWKDLWSSVKEDAQRYTEPLVPYMVGLTGRIQDSWTRMAPYMEGAFASVGPIMEDLVDVGLEFVEGVLPGITIGVTNSNKALEGLEVMAGRIGTGVGNLFIELASKQEAAGQGAALFGTLLEDTLTSAGVLLGQFTMAWANIGPQFTETFDTALDVLTNFTGNGLDGMTSSLNIALGVLDKVLQVLNPILGVFGTMGGTLLGLIASWKLLSGAIGLVVKGFTMLSPSNVAGKLTAMGTGAMVAGTNMGFFASKTGTAGNEAEKTGGKLSKVTGVLGKAAASLPIIGAIILGISEAFNAVLPSADELATKLQQGGQAAQEARDKIAEHTESIWTGRAASVIWGASQEEVNQKLREQRAAMTPLQLAQADVTKATNDHAMAVKKWGAESPEAQMQANLLAGATDRLENEQKAAADATKSHTDRMIEQTNLMLGAVGARLGYQQSLIQLEQSQKSVNEAIKAHGPASLEARDADLQYQQNLLSVINAIGQRAEAEAAARGETNTAKFATEAMVNEILRLAQAAGTNAPPALQQMVAGLDATQLEAAGATVEIDGTGQAIVRLPDGKVLKFPNDAHVAQSAIQNMTTAIHNVPETKTTKFIREYIDIVTNTKGNVSNVPGLPLPSYNADGGLFRGKGGPREDANLSWISNGEYIVNARATDANLALLQFINKGGKLQAYADGGLVGAAKEIWKAYSSGKKVYEDYSYPGQSSLVGAHNDTLASKKYSTGMSGPAFIKHYLATQGYTLAEDNSWVSPGFYKSSTGSNQLGTSISYGAEKPSNYLPTSNAFSSVYSFLGKSAGGVLQPAGSHELAKPPTPTGAATGDPALFGPMNQYFKGMSEMLGQFADKIGQALKFDGATLYFDQQGLAKLVTNEQRRMNQR